MLGLIEMNMAWVENASGQSWLPRKAFQYALLFLQSDSKVEEGEKPRPGFLTFSSLRAAICGNLWGKALLLP